MSYRYLFICNPNAGGHYNDAIKTLKQELQPQQLMHKLVFTQGPGHATDLVVEHGNNYDILVVVGGDGTLNEVINAKLAHTKILGLIPAGSGNDFARSCHIPTRDIPQALRILLRHNTKSVDLGVINDRYFINGVGFGLPATANTIAEKLRFIPGGTKYYIAILAALFTHQKLELTIDAGGVVCKNPTLLLNIANGRYQGNGLQVAPDAKLDNGSLDIMHCEHVPLHQRFIGMYHFLRGAFDKMPRTTLIKSKTVHITFNNNLLAQSDGESMKINNEVTLKVIPQAIQFIGDWKSAELK